MYILQGFGNAYLVELEGGVLANPVGAEDSQGLGHTTTNTLLSDSLVVSLGLQLVHTVVLGLTISGT